MMGYVDLARLQSLLAQQQLDGLLVVSPENFEYFAGMPGFPVTMWRRAGPASVLVTADGACTLIVPDIIAQAVRRANPDARILSHTLWIEAVDLSGSEESDVAARVADATAGRRNQRPETFDWAEVEACLRDALTASGLAGKRIGLELEFAPQADFTRLCRLFPSTEFVNSSPLIRELRLIKSTTEIDLLARGVQLTELGITAALQALGPQSTALGIRSRFHEAIHAAARRESELGFEGARTAVHLGPMLWGTGDPSRTAQIGDLVQFDSGVQIRGYKTDIGRTYCIGRPTETQQRIEAALLAGFEAGMAQLKPGRRFCDVFEATQAAVRGAGFPSYTRGHFGHSIGSDIDGEEWPRLCADEQRLLEPGMVLAFEIPYYINGVGGFQNEDNLLITEEGSRTFNQLPMQLTAVDFQ